MSESWTTLRARIAALSRSRGSQDPEVARLRQQLKAKKLEEYVASVVDRAPELTPTQLDRVASLLRQPGGGK